MFAVRQFLPEVLSMAQERGFRVVVIAPEEAVAGGGGPPEGFPEVEFRFVSIQREISLLADLRALWQIWLLLRSIRPAVTNMSTPKMALLGGVAGWLAGVPHRIYTMRGLRHETTRSWKKKVLLACEWIACRCAHRVICISRSVQEAALDQHLASPQKTILLGDRVSEGIALREPTIEACASDASLRVRLQIPATASVIGFVGRFTRDKGIPELAEAFRLLRERGHDVYLLLLGTFEAGDRVQPEIVQWLRANDHVRWPGFIADPGPYYSLMDVFVFPTHREGLGRVLLEAAAAGKPVVSTYVTGVVDVVLDGITGLLVPKGDAVALAQATECLLDQPEMAGCMGRSARALVRQQFDNSIYLRRLGDMLESLRTDGVRDSRPGLTTGLEPIDGRGLV